MTDSPVMDEARRRSAAAREIFTQLFRRSPDFTLLLTDAYLRLEGERSKLPWEWWQQYCRDKVPQRDSKLDCPPATDFEFEETLHYDATKDHPAVGVSARLQVSRCFNALAWSVTVRWTPPAQSASSERTEGLSLDVSKWKPSRALGFRRKSTADELKPFLVSISEIVTYLDSLIPQESHGHRQGLVLITGATNSGKSQIARGFSWTCLESKTGSRAAHLVTYEDPVEEYFWEKTKLDLETASTPQRLRTLIDYTPRQRRSDCDSLKDALTAALRQTPTVFYAGEVRTDEDLGHAVEFGGTGHLVIATAHAGSLVEAVARTLKAVDARRAGTRAIFVPKILAVVHLRSLATTTTVVDSGGETACSTSALVPTIYRRTSPGLQGLVADGLAALLPHCPEPGPPIPHGTLGRRFFLKSLKAKLPESDRPESKGNKDPAAEALWKVWEQVREAHFHGRPVANVRCEPVIVDMALEDDLYAK